MSKKVSGKKSKVAQPDTDWFVDSRFGMFIHWGLYALAGRHEWVMNYEKIPQETYMNYFERFEPDLYDPSAWARSAREAGMKYMVITAKHHEGFCLWDSKHTRFKATKTPWGRDVLKPLVDAFRKEGLRIGFYYSLLDWTHPEFPVDRIHPRADDAAFREATKKRDGSKYAKYMRDQVTELLTQFGKIDLLWFDFSYPGDDGKGHKDWESEKLLALVRKLQPGIMVNNRLDLPHAPDFLTPEQYQPVEMLRDASGRPVVWEGCQTFSGSWGYHRDEQTWKSVKQLLWMLIDGVSKNGNLLLNVGPTARGEFDARACERLAGIGEWMRRHARSIYGCTHAPEGFPAPPPDCRYTYNARTNRLYVHIFNWPIQHLHLPGLEGKVAYAQLLNDASEIRIRPHAHDVHNNLHAPTPEDMLTLLIPALQPPVEVPVIEVFLK
jgi:alpha-L-fucosidase